MTRLHGIDISNWQAGLKLVNTDAQFAIMKATEGTDYVDPYCDGFVQQARKAGLPYGVYHFFRGNGVAEADHFLDNVADYIGDGLLILDWEDESTSATQAKAWLDRVYQKTGIKPILYTVKSFLASAKAIEQADYGLWIAYPSSASSYGNVSPWSSAILWQYSWEHQTGGMKVDADYFYGDKATWDAYATGGNTQPQPQPDPTPDTEEDDMKTTQSEPQKRTKPQTIKADGKYHQLTLEDNGDVSFGFGGGIHEVHARFKFSDASAADELMVRVFREDTQDSKVVGDRTTYWVQGLPGGGGSSYRQFVWKWDVPAPKSGLTRRLRLEAANFSDHDMIIDSIDTIHWITK